jgi:nitric oxide reductase subunit C
MNKRQTRSFALISTAIAAVVFLGMTVDSHRQFPTLTNAQQITPQVTRGKDVWHQYNCINCHTLFGEGAYYAPDLTKITQQRGAPYLTAFLKDPSKFYDEKRHRRLMPNLKLGDEEIADLITFLDWVSKVDNQGWPPRPILVTGASIPGMDLTVAQQNATGGDQPPPGVRQGRPDRPGRGAVSNNRQPGVQRLPLDCAGRQPRRTITGRAGQPRQAGHRLA